MDPKDKTKNNQNNRKKKDKEIPKASGSLFGQSRKSNIVVVAEKDRIGGNDEGN